MIPIVQYQRHYLWTFLTIQPTVHCIILQKQQRMGLIVRQIIKSLLVATTFSRFANSRVQIRSGANEPPAVVNEQNKVWARIQMPLIRKKGLCFNTYPFGHCLWVLNSIPKHLTQFQISSNVIPHFPPHKKNLTQVLRQTLPVERFFP